MTASAIGPAQDALLALLQANATLNALRGPPQLEQPVNPASEHVWIYEDSSSERKWSQTGTGNFELEETITLKVGVIVIMTDRFNAARDRADVIAGLVEDVVKANPTLSNTVFECMLTSKRISMVAGQSFTGVLVDTTIEATAFV
jgi:hypothetical protein